MLSGWYYLHFLLVCLFHEYFFMGCPIKKLGSPRYKNNLSFSFQWIFVGKTKASFIMFLFVFSKVIYSTSEPDIRTNSTHIQFHKPRHHNVVKNKTKINDAQAHWIFCFVFRSSLLLVHLFALLIWFFYYYAGRIFVKSAPVIPDMFRKYLLLDYIYITKLRTQPRWCTG